MDKIKKIYLIPGLATDGTAYKGLVSHLNIPCEVIEFKDLDDNESLNQYAEKMSKEIDDSEPFVLVGTSFGGLLATEIAKFKHPERLVLISSAKNREELNPIMKIKGGHFFVSMVPDAIMKQIVTKGFHLTSMVRKSFKKIYNEETKAMVARSHGSFDKWIMQQINAWDSDFEHQSILHIHGDGDIVFPIKYIRDCYVIKGGTHAMLINKPKEIGKVISHFLHLPIIEN